MSGALASRKAYEMLKEMILTLELPPGELVTESELAEQTGLGRTPIREALRQLALENLILMAPRRGSIVAPVQLMDSHQIFELRTCLEGLAASLAAQRIDEVTLQELETIVDRVEEGSAFEDSIPIDRKFHMTIAHATKNKFLAQAIENVLEHSIRLGYLAGSHRPLSSLLIDMNYDLIEALREGDSERSRDIMVEHIEDFVREVRSRM